MKMAAKSALLFLCVNLYGISLIVPTAALLWTGLPIAAVAFLALNIRPTGRRFLRVRDKLMYDGAKLLRLFLGAAALSCCFLPVLGTLCIPTGRMAGFWGALLLAVLGLALAFWNGILRLYCTSTQLGIKWRVLGALCGMIPVVHLFVLGRMIRMTEREAVYEQEKLELDAARAESAVCATRYPILLVHGIFFRDMKLFNYWGRIPAVLKRNGAQVFYGAQQSADSVENSAQELVRRIDTVCAQTGCARVNIIAHSKGGLDSRFAVSALGADARVASLTTICTPHRGCRFAEVLLQKIPAGIQRFIAKQYAGAFRLLGDEAPDFLAGVRDLTVSASEARNQSLADSPRVFYQSVAAVMRRARGGKFPLCLSWRLVKKYDGPNDGLVGAASAVWGENHRLLQPTGRRGLTHGDMIDLNRENIDGFDVREFYVELVHGLKTRGF